VTRIFTCVDSGETSDAEVQAYIETSNDVHGGEFETSNLPSHPSHLVRTDRLRRSVPRFSSKYLDFTERNSVEWYARTARSLGLRASSGIRPRQPREGEKLWAIMIDHLVAFLEDLKASASRSSTAGTCDDGMGLGWDLDGTGMRLLMTLMPIRAQMSPASHAAQPAVRDRLRDGVRRREHPRRVVDERGRWVGIAAPDEAVTESLEAAASAINQVIRPHVFGAEPTRVVRLAVGLERLARSQRHEPRVEMAMWDLLAKRAGLPLYQLLGGYRTHIMTSITIGISSLKDTVAESRERVRQGFRALKIKGGRDLDEDVERLLKTREAVGPRIRLRFDANQAYDADQTLVLIEAHTRRRNSR
jgi:hypothetical protein